MSPISHKCVKLTLALKHTYHTHNSGTFYFQQALRELQGTCAPLKMYLKPSALLYDPPQVWTSQKCVWGNACTGGCEWILKTEQFKGDCGFLLMIVKFKYSCQSFYSANQLEHFCALISVSLLQSIYGGSEYGSPHRKHLSLLLVSDHFWFWFSSKAGNSLKGSVMCAGLAARQPI